MAGSFTITGMSAGLQGGEKIMGPNTMSGGSTVGTILDATLATGDNIFTVPSLAVGCTIFIPSTNTSALYLRSNLDPADTGLPVNPSGPWVAWPLVSGQTQVIIHATVGGASVELWFI